MAVWTPKLPPYHNSGNDYKSSSYLDYFPFVLAYGSLRFMLLKLDNHTLQLERQSYICPIQDLPYILNFNNVYPGSVSDPDWAYGQTNHGWGENLPSIPGQTGDPCGNNHFDGNNATADQGSNPSGCASIASGPVVQASYDDWGSAACLPNITYMQGFKATPCSIQGGSSGWVNGPSSAGMDQDRHTWGWNSMLACTTASYDFSNPPRVDSTNDQFVSVDGYVCNLCSPNINGCSCTNSESGDYRYADNFYASSGAWFHSSGTSFGDKVAHQGKGPYNDTFFYHGFTQQSGHEWSETVNYNTAFTSVGWANDAFYNIGHAMQDMVNYDSLGSYHLAGAFIGYKTYEDYSALGNNIWNQGLEDEELMGMNGPCDVTNTGMTTVNMGNQFSDFRSNLIFPPGYDWRMNFPSFESTNYMIPKEGGTNGMSYYAIVLLPTTEEQKANAGNEYNGLDFKLHLDVMSVAFQKVMGENYQFNTTGGPLGDGTNYSGITGSAYMNTLPSQPIDIWDVGFRNGDPLKDYTPLVQSNCGLQHQLPTAWAERVHGDFTKAQYIYLSNPAFAQTFGGIIDGEFEKLSSDWWDANSSAASNPWGVQILNPLQKHIIKEVAYKGYPAELTPSYAHRDNTILVVKTPACAPHWRLLTMNCLNSIDLREDNPYFNLHITGQTDSGMKTVMFRDVCTGFQDDASEVQSYHAWADHDVTFTGFQIPNGFTYPFEWQAGASMGKLGAGVGYNENIYGTTTLAGLPIRAWREDYDPAQSGDQNVTNIEVIPVQYTGLSFFMSDATDNWGNQVDTAGKPEWGDFAAGSDTTNPAYVNSHINKTGRQQAVWYDFDSRTTLHSNKVASSSYDWDDNTTSELCARPYNIINLNGAGHANYTSSVARHNFRVVTDNTSGNMSWAMCISAVTTYDDPNMSLANWSQLSNNALATGRPMSHYNSGLTDSTAHVRFLGVWNYKMSGAQGASGNPTGFPWYDGQYGVTSKFDRYKEVLRYVKHVDFSTGGFTHPSADALEYVWKPNSGIKVLPITDSQNINVNNWSMQTGNGMIYNASHLQSCPFQVTVTADPPPCAASRGTLIFTVQGGAASWVTVELIGAGTYNSNVPTVVPIVLDGNNYTYKYSASSLATASGTSLIPNSFVNGTTYTFSNLPTGTYTFNATTGFNDGGCNITVTETLGVTNDFPIGLPYGVSVDYSGHACGDTDLTALVAFSAIHGGSNNSPNSGFITWALYEDDGTGVFKCRDFGVPWTTTNTIPAGGSNATGQSNSVANISTPGDNVGLSTTAHFEISNIKWEFIQNNYKVILHKEPAAYNVINRSLTDASAMAAHSACAESTAFSTQCATVDIDSVTVHQPMCDGDNDEEYHVPDTNFAMDSTGHSPTNGYSLSQLGFIDVYLNNSLPGNVIQIVDATGTEPVPPFTQPSSISTPVVFPYLIPGNYTINVYLDNFEYQNINPQDTSGPHTITFPTPTTISASTVTDATCSGCDGTITGAVLTLGSSDQCQNGGGAYCANCPPMYAITDLANPLQWTDPGTGIFEFEVFDSNGIVGPQWNSSFTGLCAGTYYVVGFSNQCACAVVDGPYTVGSGQTFNANITTNQSACNSTASSIEVAVSSGTDPYTYTWTSTDPLFVAPSTLPTASVTSSVVANTTSVYDYECVVTDQSGCPPITLGPVSVTIPTPILVNGVASSIGCGGGTGSITTSPSGGSAPYSWAWSGSSSATTQNLSSIGVGTYTVVVTDNAGCTATETFSITNSGSAETFIDVNQYEYNQAYTDSTTGTANDDLLEGMYGGPTCPSGTHGKDGTIRLMLDSSTPTGTFPYDVFIRPSGSGPYQQVTNNSGSNLSVTSVQAYDTSSGNIVSTSAPYDPYNVAPNTYFQITGNSDKAGGALLEFTAGSTWDVKLVETGGSTCESVVTVTILPSDYQNVIATDVTTQPTSCGCSSFGASTLNNCNGAIDLSPLRGTYENHVGDLAYTYLWTYAANTPLCTPPELNNFNTQWTNLTTQDISAQWPGVYTYTVTDKCGGTATDNITLVDPIIYIEDITGTRPSCADCPDGILDISICHPSGSNFEISIDNGNTWSSATTFNNLWAGIYSVWVRDDSGCVTEYFADPDDSPILLTYDDHGHADFVPCLHDIATSVWDHAYSSQMPGTSAPTAYTEPSCTKIKLDAISDFTDANVCVTNHNQFPGDTSASITLNLTGGTPPYTISAQASSGPVYSASTGLIPCMGIGPLTATPDPCTLTGTTIPTIGLGSNIWEISEDNGVTWNDFDAGGSYYTTSATSFKIENVSVSLDLGSSFLGAQYTFYVQDSLGCVKTGIVGVDNGIFGIISVYGAENCDCVCPPGFELDTTVGSPTNGECISTQIEPIISNGSTEYWTTATALYTGGTLPGSIASNGAILYGAYSSGSVNYGLSIAVNLLALPFVKDVTTAGSNLLVMTDNTGPIIGADISAYNSTSGVWAQRIAQIAIWRNSGTVGVFPVTPQDEWIGTITEINFASQTEVIIAISGSEEVRMYLDGVEWIHLKTTSGNATTIADNTDYVHLFPLILPAGLHAISFQAMNTTSNDSYLAYEIYPKQMAFGTFTGSYFVTAAQDPAFTLGDLTANILQDANGDNLSSLSFDNQEIQIGIATSGDCGTMGYCCPTSGTTVQLASNTMFCQSDVTAPCEVPLDCGNCYDVDGNPAPTWTKKGPCESATDQSGVLLANEWVSDDSALSDLVECPGSLANEALAKIHGALASNVLDIRQIWLTIMIKHMLKNLNICFSLQDIQDSFTGYLDEVCPTCDVGENLTPAEMSAVVSQIFNTNNSNFDF